MTTNLKTRQYLPVELAVESAAPAPASNPEFRTELADSFVKGIYNSQHEALVLGDKIGGGGEGTVYDIEGHVELVAKIYHAAPTAEKVEKLLALAKLGNERLFKMAAWPVDVLRDRPDGNVIGFVMRKIGQAAEVHTLHSPKSRLKKFPEASWAFLLHVATNIARAVATMHEHGFVIGDVNPKNILVTRQATVYLLDCDSFQFTSEGKTYRCGGGFPEYTPPELQGIPFADIDRSPEHDCFGLAVVIFQLLFLGRHPYSGRFLGTGELPLEQAIRELRFAYGEDAATRQMQPPPGTLSLTAIPAELIALFRRAFLATDRPNPIEWLSPLEWFSQALQPCALHNGHYYYKQMTACPWCDLEARSGVRLFHFRSVYPNAPRASFRLDEIWAEIETLGQIKRLPLNTNVSVTKLSAEAKNYALIRNLRYWLAIGISLLGGGFIAWVADMPSALWFLLFVGYFAHWIAKVNPDDDLFFFQRLLLMRSNSSVEPLSKKLRAATHIAETRLKQLEQQLWGKTNGEQEFYDLLKEIKAQKQEYDALDQQTAVILKRSRAKAYTAALENFLRQYAVKDSGHVSASMADWMQGKRIVTAADISEHQLRNNGVVNEFHLQKLLHWRQELEAQFNFNPSSHIPPEARLLIEKELDAQRQRLEGELTSKTHTLRTLKQQLEERRKLLLPKWTENKLTLSKAEKDLEEVSKENRLMPVKVTLVAAFLLFSAMQNFSRFDFPADLLRPGSGGQVNMPKGVEDTATINSPECRRYFEQAESKFQTGQYREAKDAYQQAISAMHLLPWEPGFTRVIYKYCLTVEMLNETKQEIMSLEKQLAQIPDDHDRAKLIILSWVKSQDALARKQYLDLKKSHPAMAESMRAFLGGFGFNLETIPTE